MMPQIPLTLGWGWPQLSQEFMGHFLWLGAVAWMFAEVVRLAAHRAGAEFRSLLSVMCFVLMLGAAGVACLLTVLQSALPVDRGADSTAAILLIGEFASRLWIVGTVLLATLVLSGIVRIRRLRSAAVPFLAGAAAETLERSRRLLAVPQPVRVAATDQLRLPILIGTQKPIMLLPASAASWSDSDIEQVVVHELAHVRRCDNFVMLCQRLAECLLWFHPGVWCISRWIDEEREFCCDDLVLAVTDRREDYAQLLIGLLSGARSSSLPVSALRGSSVPRRVRRILFLEEALMSHPVQWRAMLLALLCICSRLLVAGAPPEQPVAVQPTAAPVIAPPPAVVEVAAPIETVIKSLDVPLPPIPLVPATIVPTPFLGKTGTEPPPAGAAMPKRPYGPEQAVGPPDSEGAGDKPTAWASYTENDSPEWLVCEFESPVHVKIVSVHENFNPGAVIRLTAFGPDNQEIVAWEGEDPTSRGDGYGISVFPVRLPFAVQKIKLDIDSVAVPGWNEIDAVGLTDMQGVEHWATRATASTTYAEQNPAKPNEKRNWGPEQAAGEPDTLEAGDQVTAWASQAADGTQEWLVCEYAEAASPAEVVIHETFNPGAVHKLTSIADDGSEAVLWEGVDPTPRDQPRGVSVYPIEPAAPIKKLKVYIDSASVPGWNEIDAVGMRNIDGDTQWAANVEASSTFAQQAQDVVFSVDPDSQVVFATIPTRESQFHAQQQAFAALKQQVEELRQFREELDAMN